MQEKTPNQTTTQRKKEVANHQLMQFKDNRTQNKTQQRMQNMIADSSQVRQLQSYQNMADNKVVTNTTQSKPNHTGLPNKVKHGIENLSGYNMDDVKVHYNSAKPAQLQAHAYAQGTDIYVGAGQEKHIAHEAWHVVQQKQGRVTPTIQKRGVAINNDTMLEREADLMGAKAVQLASSHQTPYLKNGNVSSNPAVQGKFGFELELTIATEFEEGGAYYDPKRKVGITLGQGNQFKLNVDHQETKAIIGEGVVSEDMYKGEGAPIIEIVTDPFDEFDPNINDQIETLISDLNSLEQKLLSARGKREPLNNMVAAKSNNLVVGGAKVGRQNTNSYTHATYGVKLSKVSDTFSEHALDIIDKRGEGNERAVGLNKAATAGQEIADWMFAKYKDRHTGIIIHSDLNKYDIHNESDIDSIKGVLTLLGNYMITYTRYEGKLMKNGVGALFYKSKLSDLIGHLSDKQQTLLTERSDKIADKLIEKCIDQRGNDLENIDWRPWVLEVLKGQDDRMLKRAKNPYSPVLGPDQLGPSTNKETGVVVENRHVVELLKGYGRKVPATEWGDMIRSIKDKLRGING